MKKIKLKTLALICMLVSGCASVADKAQWADVGTTAVALNSGFSEGNPIWNGASWPIMAVAKLGTVQVIKQTPQHICEPGLMGFSLVGSGAALWNLGVIAGAGPAAFPVIAALWAFKWDDWVIDAKTNCQ